VTFSSLSRTQIRRWLARTIYKFKYNSPVAEIQKRALRMGECDYQFVKRYQTVLFNEVWKNAYTQFSIYSDLKKSFGLPDRVECIDEVSLFPILTRQMIQEYSAKIQSEAHSSAVRSTGGSSGEPLEFPVDFSNERRSFLNLSAGRLIHKISSEDRLALVWGHSHLFGSGLRGRLNVLVRKTQDYLVNIDRFNAYDSTEKAAANYANSIALGNYKAVIGYSSTLRAIAWAAPELSSFPSKWILTSEQIYPTDQKLFWDRMNAEIVCEYGLAEFGPVAYSLAQSEELAWFWWSFAAFIEEDGALRLTDLEATAFPFINYQTGDLVETTENALRWKSVRGRDGLELRLPVLGGDLIEVHSELLTHIIKNSNTRAFNLEQGEEGLTIHLACISGQLEGIARAIIRDILLEYPNVDTSRIHIDGKYIKVPTLAGKERINVSILE